MKKIFLTLMVMVAAVAANAQVWVGGSLGFRTFSEAEGAATKTTLDIKPEVGYDLSEDWSIAIALGYSMDKPEEGDAISTISVNPYARYNVIKAGNFKAFLDGGFGFESADEVNDWNIAIKPGIAYSLNENFCIVGHLGDGLIYRGGDTKSQNGIALDIFNGVSFGVYYAF
ncbi:MAG: outer membrane beta-barrel protein [Bacteroidaceae bacterium]|nr:outer membrane beta-barrel protein [Bacteroidaceae bacterium]